MKTVLITGASSGIGKELALVFAERNYRPVLVARRKQLLENLAQEIKTSFFIDALIIPLDLAQTDSAEKLMEIIEQKDIEVNVLVNNAGFGDFGPFQEEDMGRIQDMILLNMLTLTKLSRLIAPKIVRSGFGHIVNIASSAAFQPVPNFAVYAATKAYVLQFSEAIAYELKSKGVYVTTICPGATQTEFQEQSGMNSKMFRKAPMAFLLAEFTYRAMMKKKTVAIYGASNRFLAFMIRFSPRRLATSMAGKMMSAD